MREGLLLTLVGCAVGICGALVLMRAMRSLLFGVESSDPVVFASISMLLLIVAAVACYVPARRAASIDPIGALRME